MVVVLALGAAQSGDRRCSTAILGPDRWRRRLVFEFTSFGGAGNFATAEPGLLPIWADRPSPRRVAGGVPPTARFQLLRAVALRVVSPWRRRAAGKL